MEHVTVTILGVRGTAPISGAVYQTYGGATSCILVEMGGQQILLDAGSGLLSIKHILGDQKKSLHVLLSHPHLDHLEGLTGCPVFFEPDSTVTIHAVPRSGLSALEQIEALFSPPLWPVGIRAFAADISAVDILSPTFYIGPVRVDWREGSHPGGCAMFRLTYQETSIVYATDFEQDMGADEGLCEFARDCDLLLCDGEYTKEELVLRRGFGHSTWEFAAEIGKACGAGQTRIVHHSLYRTDAELNRILDLLSHTYPTCSPAYAGEELSL